ncbi:MAG: AraC family transcriptional regulator [Rikenellaceae bacterium]
MSNTFAQRWREIVDKLSSHEEEEKEEAAVPNSSEPQCSTSAVCSDTTELGTTTYERIEVALLNWVATKGYCNKGITIESLAITLHTNRNYLSHYINRTQGSSFKVWLTRLRLDEAKRLLCDDDKHSIVAISELIGFSSTMSFIHVFKRNESLPPALWREKHKELRAALMPLCDDVEEESK